MPAVHLVRHGRSTWNDEGRIQGWTAHPPLTELGREQAAAAVEPLRRLLGADPVRLVSSDLVRARQTAQIIGSGLRLPVQLDQRLREQALGRLEGRLAAELTPQPDPPGVPPEQVRWGGTGESLADVWHRWVGFLADRGVLEGVDHLVLVTHGDALRVALAVLDGRTAAQVDWDAPVDNGSVHSRVLPRRF